MSRLIEAHGVAVSLPEGWDGRIFRRRSEPRLNRGHAELSIGPFVATTHAVAHAGDFPLPVEHSDFGARAVETMPSDAVFVALVEYHPDAAATALFDHAPPKRLRAADFDPAALEHHTPGRAGLQRFFSQRGRAFCLYAVIGDGTRAAVLTPRVNAALQALRIT